MLLRFIKCSYTTVVYIIMCCLCPGELDSRGWKMKDIILVHLYVRSMGDFVPLNAVYKEHFGMNPPAR